MKLHISFAYTLSLIFYMILDIVYSQKCNSARSSLIKTYTDCYKHYSDYKCCKGSISSRYFSINYCYSMSNKYADNYIYQNSDNSLKIEIECFSNSYNSISPDDYYPVIDAIDYPVPFSPGLALLTYIGNNSTDNNGTDNNGTDNNGTDNNNTSDPDISIYTQPSEVPARRLAEYYKYKYYSSNTKDYELIDKREEINNSFLNYYNIKLIKKVALPPINKQSWETFSEINTNSNSYENDNMTSCSNPNNCLFPCCHLTVKNNNDSLVKDVCINTGTVLGLYRDASQMGYSYHNENYNSVVTCQLFSE